MLKKCIEFGNAQDQAGLYIKKKNEKKCTKKCIEFIRK